MSFFQLFSLANIGQKNVFYDILEQKNAFLGYKNKKFKLSKIDIFPKGLTYGFGRKISIFPFFLLRNIGQKKFFDDILQRKNAFLRFKNKKLKKSKNWHFSKKANPWFWFRNCHFWKFFFRQYRPGKCLLWYSRTKKRLCRLLKQEVEKVDKLTFFQRGKPIVLVQKWPFF